jgi:DNA-binding Xre family transcriptional regulator
MDTNHTPTTDKDLPAKIAKLVVERGWNNDDFSRIAGINRHTVRQIMLGGGGRRLRNTTVSACAKALGLTVNELRGLPLEVLLPRMVGQRPLSDDDNLRALFVHATQPELRGWLERNPERARQFTVEEFRELLALQGEGGPLANYGVEHFVELILRKRRLLRRVRAIAASEYLPLLEQIVGLLAEKIGANHLD